MECRFTSVSEFESFVDTLLASGVASNIQEMCREKDRAIEKGIKRVKKMCFEFASQMIESDGTKDLLLHLITKNEFELMTLTSCGINTKELNFNLSFGFTQKMCQILDEYEGAKTHDSFKRDLNAEFGIIVHQALLPLRDHMGSFPASILAILDTLNELLNDHHFESLTGLLEIFDHFYVHVASLYQELLVFKRQTFTKMKQCLVEMALASIVEDLERVTEEEAQGFRESRREMLSQASMMDVNFAKFDVDEIIEE